METSTLANTGSESGKITRGRGKGGEGERGEGGRTVGGPEGLTVIAEDSHPHHHTLITLPSYRLLTLSSHTSHKHPCTHSSHPFITTPFKMFITHFFITLIVLNR